MSKDPAFLFYSSDFLTGTILMTNEQVGIYIKLLCVQHQHGGILDKRSFLSMIKGNEIIKTKFVETKDGFFNERLMKEMESRRKKSSNLSANAIHGWEKRKQMQCKCNANASDLHMPIEDENENENENINKDKSIITIKHFESIWSMYPKRVGRKMAEKHFKSSVKTIEDLEKLEKALGNYLSSKRVANGFVQNGSTFMNNWTDWIDYKEETCKKCKDKGTFTSATGYSIICDCPAGRKK